VTAGTDGPRPRPSSRRLPRESSVAALLGDVPWLRRLELLPAPSDDDDAADAATPDDRAADDALLDLAANARRLAGAEVGLAVRARPHGGDTVVAVAIVHPLREHRERSLAFLGGSNGRTRAALTAAAVLLAEVRRSGQARDRGSPAR
jgi:hypothetical protein